MSETLVEGLYSLSRHAGPDPDPERPGYHGVPRYQITTPTAEVILTREELELIARAALADMGKWPKRRYRYSRKHLAQVIRESAEPDHGMSEVWAKLLEREPL